MAVSRIKTSLLVVSAATIVGLANYEGYEEEAYVPVPGDVYTIGFGTTKGVKPGDVTNPVRALNMLLDQVENKYAKRVRECVKVPLAQYEFAAFVSLAYNIGTNAFCKSTLVKKANREDYAGACAEILRWDKFKGEPLPGLTKRRKKEFAICMGAA